MKHGAISFQAPFEACNIIAVHRMTGDLDYLLKLGLKIWMITTSFIKH